jgi:hypothetical protein
MANPQGSADENPAHTQIAATTAGCGADFTMLKRRALRGTMNRSGTGG